MESPPVELLKIIPADPYQPYSPENSMRLRLSPSKMVAWDECKQKFRNAIYQEEKDQDTIYTCLGTAAHTVIETINKGAILDGDARETLLKQELLRLCAEKSVPINFTAGYKETRDVVRTYEIPPGWELFKAENKQVLNFEKFDFSFIADSIWICHANKTIPIVDYKTSAAVPKNPIQLMCYPWAARARYPEIQKYLDEGYRFVAMYHMLRQDKLVTYEITEETLFQTDRMISMAVAQMERMFKVDFFPTEPGPGCWFCPLVECEDRKGTRNE